MTRANTIRIITALLLAFAMADQAKADCYRPYDGTRSMTADVERRSTAAAEDAKAAPLAVKPVFYLGNALNSMFGAVFTATAAVVETIALPVSGPVSALRNCKAKQE